MTRQQFVMLVGVVMFAIGLGGLLWPASITPGKYSDPVSCGSPLLPDTKPAEQEARTRSSQLAEAAGGYVSNTYAKDFAQACDDARNARHRWTWPVGLIGLGGIIYAGAVMKREEQEQGTA